MLQILDEHKQNTCRIENLSDINNTFYLLIQSLKEGLFDVEAEIVNEAYKHFSDKIKDLLKQISNKKE